jgi:transcriptional regulator with XRE-family HTH domain
VSGEPEESARSDAAQRLAENIRRAREKFDVSLHALSAKTEVDRKSLRSIEAAEFNPSLKTLERIADAFDMTIAELFGASRGSARPSLLDAPTLVALNVKRLRRTRDWSAADLAERTLMKAAYVSLLETGKRGCTLRTLLRLAAGFQVDVVQLLTRPAAHEHELLR